MEIPERNYWQNSHTDSISLVENSVEISESLQVANVLSTYFTSVGENLAFKFSNDSSNNNLTIPSPSPVCSSFKPNSVDSNLHQFQLEVVEPVQVFDQLNQLDVKKATGLDAIPAWLLKECSGSLACPISHIFNASLISGVVSIKFKTAKVTPLFKKGDKTQKTIGQFQFCL